MRKKSIAETYLRDVKDYKMAIFEEKEKNAFISIKQILRTQSPFTILNPKGQEVTLIDTGYYIVEFTPMGAFWNGRVFLDEKQKVLEYYFDMSLQNGVEDGVPYYDDLYLDVIYDPNEDGFLLTDDLDELDAALTEKQISMKEHALALKTAEMILTEIHSGTNAFVNLDKATLIEKTLGY